MNTVMEGMKLGISDYVVKPFKRDDLLNRIDCTLKKYGVIPVEPWELRQSVNELSDLIHTQKWKQAIAKANEISGYQVSEEVYKRIKTVCTKLEEGDYPEAQQTVNRVIRLLDTRDGDQANSKGHLEWSLQLHGVLEALDNFDNKKAIKEMVELMNYDMPVERHKVCQEVLTSLKNYDDSRAEKLLIQLLDEATKVY
jgi:YesN/AraC family two-component response regulator